MILHFGIMQHHLKFEDNFFDGLISLCSHRSMESIWSLIDDQSVPDHYGQWDLSSIKNWIQNTKITKWKKKITTN